MISMRFVVLVASLLASLTAAQACPTHAVPLAPPAADGPDKEVKELLDTPFVKLVSITLRKGTVLPDHAAPVPVTLQALAGAGNVKVGDEVTALSAGQMMLLAPGAVHSVTPSGQEALVVLVHYLKGQGGPHAAHGGHGADHAAHGGEGACQGGDCPCKGGDCPCKDGSCAHGGQTACPHCAGKKAGP